MKIDYQLIDHKDQRYETSGDWWWDNYEIPIDEDTLHVRGSHISDWRLHFCEMIHEIFEAVFCRYMGITHQQVDAFDMPLEAAHQRGDSHYPCGCPNQRLSDPGRDIHSPYRIPHLMAETAEAIAGRFLQIDWKAYDEEVEKPTP